LLRARRTMRRVRLRWGLEDRRVFALGPGRIFDAGFMGDLGDQVEIGEADAAVSTGEGSDVWRQQVGLGCLRNLAKA
jgi:hypothetical protein